MICNSEYFENSLRINYFKYNNYLFNVILVCKIFKVMIIIGITKIVYIVSIKYWLKLRQYAYKLRPNLYYLCFIQVFCNLRHHLI